MKQIGCVLALLFAPGWLVAQTQTYSVTELATPAGGFVQGGNNVGEYVGGILSSPNTAILWTSPTATPITLSPLGGGGGPSIANAINDAGAAVGFSGVDALHVHATLWQGDSVKDLGILPGYRSTQATAINSAGVAVGVGTSATAVDIENNPIDHAFLFSNGTVTDLGTLGGSSSVANAINSAGQIVGWSNIPSNTNPPSHATLWNSNVSTDLGTLGGNNSFAMAINSAGVIVGEAELASVNIANQPITHATMWKDGLATDLGVLESGTLSNALAINSSGDIVGVSDTFPNNTSPQDVQHAVLWSKGQIIDLNSKLPAALQAEVVLEYAQTIADDGSIIAEARNQSTGNCCSRVFLLTPIPPLAVSCPSSAAQVTAAYSSAAIASGGVPPYVFSISGSLPPGLALASRSGAISGTPTAAGTFNFTVQATDSSSGAPTVATHACTISVIPRPDFSIQTTPNALNLQPGVRGSVVISLSPTNSFAGTVALSVSGAPTGVRLLLHPSSISGAQTATLTIHAGGAAVGTFSIVVTGSSGSLTHSTNVTLTISAKSTLTVSPTSLSFDRVHHYAPKFKQIEVTNSGETPVSIGEPHVKGGEEARHSFVPLSLCGHTLQPAHSCRIVVAFLAEHLGRFSATLEIPAKPTNPPTVALSAEVIPLRE
jgi:probable HAF family extracellular repeat protein